MGLVPKSVGKKRPSLQSRGAGPEEAARAGSEGREGPLLSSPEPGSPSLRVSGGGGGVQGGGGQTLVVAGGGAAPHGEAGMRGADAAAPVPHSAAAPPDWSRAVTPRRARQAGLSL